MTATLESILVHHPQVYLVKDGLSLNMGFSSWYHSLRNSELTQAMDPAPLWINPELSSMGSDPLESWMRPWGKSLQPSERLFCTLSNGHDNASFSEHCKSLQSSHVQGAWPRQIWNNNKNLHSLPLLALPLSREPWIQGRKMKAADWLLGTDRDFWTLVLGSLWQ